MKRNKKNQIKNAIGIVMNDGCEPFEHGSFTQVQKIKLSTNNLIRMNNIQNDGIVCIATVNSLEMTA